MCNSKEVSIEKEENYIVFFNNTYTPEAVSPNIVLVGEKKFYGREDSQWLESDIFSFRLQKYDGIVWQDMFFGEDESVTATVTKDKKTFDFSDTLRSEVYTHPGVYSYRVIEDISENPKVSIVYFQPDLLKFGGEYLRHSGDLYRDQERLPGRSDGSYGDFSNSALQ